MYIGETSPPSVRGKLGVFFELAICVGILAVYLLGTYISYWQVAFVCTGVSAVQSLLMFTIRESPRLSRNPLKNIRARLIKRQNDSVTEETTCNQTIKAISTYGQEAFVNSTNYKSYAARIAIVVGLLVFQAVSGVDAIISLAGPIFRAAGLANGVVSSGLLSFLAIGAVMIVFTVLFFFVIDRFGRRIPLFFGGLSLMVADVGMAMYFTAAFGFVSTSGSGNSSMERSNASIQNCVSVPLEPSSLASTLSPLPVASVCLFFAAFSLAWGTVPWIVAGELFPEQIREIGMGISAAILWICIILMMSGFPLLSAAVGLAVPFLVLAVISLLSSIFVVFFLPETKGLRLDEISSMEVVNVRKNVKEFGRLLGWLLCGGFVRKMNLPLS